MTVDADMFWKAIARVWVRAGAEGVVICGRRKEKLDETIGDLEKLNTGNTRTLAVVADTTKEEHTEHLFAQVNKAFGRAADVVFANAGKLTADLPLADEDVRTWWSAFVSQNDMCESCARPLLSSVNRKSTYWVHITPLCHGSKVNLIRRSPLARS